MKEISVSKGLGYFSIALGATELFAPYWLGKKIGVIAEPKIVRSFGLREIGAGVKLLKSPEKASGLWARFAGDLVDLGFLFRGLKETFNKKRVFFAIAMVVGVTALDAICAGRLGD